MCAGEIQRRDGVDIMECGRYKRVSRWVQGTNGWRLSLREYLGVLDTLDVAASHGVLYVVYKLLSVSSQFLGCLCKAS